MSLVVPTQGRPEPLRDEEGIGRQLRLVYLGAVVVAAVLVLWSTFAVIAGAIIAGGTLVVQTEVKAVQHPTGGVVGAILVKNGDRVRAGDLMIRLDETVARANLQIIVSQMIQLEMKETRLLTERRGEAEMVMPQTYVGKESDPEVATSFREEATFHAARLRAREGQKAQYQERIAQLEQEIVGLEAQQAARTRQRELVDQELGGVRELYAKNLVQLTRLSQLEQRLSELDGVRGQIVSGLAQSKSKIAEMRLASLQLDADMLSEVSSELRDTQSKLSELAERRRAAEDQLTRLEIRAPSDGVVNDLKAHTVGGVIGAGEIIAKIVPDRDVLVVEARVSPQDIGQVEVDQPAAIRFSAFDRPTTPELDGRVGYISADLSHDPATGVGYYVVRLVLDDGEADRLGDRRLIPGMPAEVHMRTGERTVMSYLLKPLVDQASRALRER